MFSFNGINLDNYINYVTNIQGLETPSTRDYEVEVLHKNGNYYSETLFQSRVITISCIILNSDKTKYEKLDDLKKVLFTRNIEKPLTLNCYNDRFINARYSGTMPLTMKGHLEFNISFKCSDPLFYSNNLYNNNLSNGNNIITSNGNFDTGNIILYLTLPYNQNVIIANSAINQGMTLINTIGPSDIPVRIDFKNGTITSPSLDIDYIKFFKDGQFFNLAAGTNNIICSNLTGTNYIEYRNAFI